MRKTIFIISIIVSIIFMLFGLNLFGLLEREYHILLSPDPGDFLRLKYYYEQMNFPSMIITSYLSMSIGFIIFIKAIYRFLFGRYPSKIFKINPSQTIY